MIIFSFAVTALFGPRKMNPATERAPLLVIWAPPLTSAPSPTNHHPPEHPRPEPPPLPPLPLLSSFPRSWRTPLGQWWAGKHSEKTTPSPECIMSLNITGYSSRGIKSLDRQILFGNVMIDIISCYLDILQFKLFSSTLFFCPRRSVYVEDYNIALIV